jgi:hypothetical protein
MSDLGHKRTLAKDRLALIQIKPLNRAGITLGITNRPI